MEGLYKIKVYNENGDVIQALSIPPNGKLEVLDLSGASLELKNSDDMLGIILDAFDADNEYHSSWHCLYDDLTNLDTESIV